MADVESIGDGAHDRAHREAVEVVVHEDDDAQHRSENLRHLRVLDVRRHPLAYARDPPAAAMTTTRRPNARNSSSAPLPAICSAIICGTMVNESTSGLTPTPLERELVDHHAHEHADGQRGIHLLRDRSAKPSARIGGMIDHTPVLMRSNPSI